VSEPKAKAGCGYAFMAAIVAFGLFLVWVGSRPAAPADLTARRIASGLGIVTVAGGLLFWIPMQGALARQRARARLESEFPDQPWHWRPDWHRGRIEAGGARAAIAMWFFAVVWNVFGWGSLAAAWSQLVRDRAGVWVVLVFPLVGLLLLGSAVHQTIRALKFGRPVFLPTTVPGVIGGYLGGVIRVPVPLRPDQDVLLSLQACRTRVHGSGKNRSVQTDVLWEHEVRIPPEKLPAGATGTDLPVLFHVPAGQPDSELTTSDPRTFWRLRARAPVAGVDFDVGFEVPVFATGETVAAPDAGQPLLAEYRPETTMAAESLAAAGITLQPTGQHGFPAIEFSSRHLRGTKIAMTLLALGTTAGVATLIGFGYGIAAFFAGFFDLIFVLVAYSVWMGETVLELQPAEVIVRSRRLSGWKEQRLPRREVALVQIEKSMRSGENQYFKLVLVGHPGADPAHPAPGEPFAVRKLRYQLERARKNPGTAPAGQTQPELLASLRLQPRFRVVVANHVPGPALAESVARLVERRIATAT
jgi:hypothetical protein